MVSFDSGLALETINHGLPVVPFWSEYASRTLRERIHQRLRENLSNFATADNRIV
ncbi:hypothetical protein [Crinalium epipsammum]|uniref:hypothetical protein n=1 Tax=Crinalium epipsammum TaxID=241425 RepID=UPI0003200E43|nr:hypothetical protein [Crinalium epipsammum]